MVCNAPAVTAAPTPPRVCCKAMSATCMACSKGVSVTEYCKSNPKVQGCDVIKVTCDVNKGPSAKGCPVAKCAGPPQGCSPKTVFAMTNTQYSRILRCCPKLCLYVDKSGKACSGA